MFSDYIQKYLTQINDLNDQVQVQYAQELSIVSPQIKPLFEAFHKSSLGGKRVRGILAILGYQMVNGDKPFNQDILKVSVALEIFQTAILAHDDIADQSQTRRGQKTLYMALGGDHYGISQALTMGDVGFFFAQRQILQTSFESNYKLKAIDFFIEMMLKTAWGQLLDIELSTKSKSYSETDSLTISRYKTAWYTIIGPLSLGVILAGGDDRLLGLVEKFGENLGIAFQIQDDILGVFGSEEVLGKSVTSDIEEGKNTLMIAHALSHASEADREILNKLYGNPNTGSDQLAEVRRIFETSGSLQYAQDQAQIYVERAKGLITDITDDPKYQQLLDSLCDLMVKRDK
jgi:geranylgeranyl diphosphate synthase type I